MRISDWSSDVCSSDLRAGNHRRQGFRFLASLWTGAQMNAPFRNTAILDHAVRPLRQYLDDDGVTEVVINEPTIVGVERHGGWRSEEHTSELQSLMRISYAVFCLKKKTYTDISYLLIH